MSQFIEAVRGGIIVSCQAVPDDPTYGPAFMVAFAKSAQRGGAVGIRANGAEDVAAIKSATGMPVIGIKKHPGLDGKGVLITPTVSDALQLKQAGADIIALDVSDRVRPDGLDAETLIQRIHAEVGLPVMGDCFTLEDAVRAARAGADVVAPTLSQQGDAGPYAPDYELLRQMVAAVNVPVIAEGRYWDPEAVAQGFALGAHAIVIGSAITRPWLITERYANASPRAKVTR